MMQVGTAGAGLSSQRQHEQAVNRNPISAFGRPITLGAYNYVGTLVEKLLLCELCNLSQRTSGRLS